MSDGLKSSRPYQSRRKLLGNLWKGLGVVALMEFIGVSVAFLLPGEGSTDGEQSREFVNAGNVDQFAPGSVTAFIQGQFYLTKLENGKFIALSRRCTHLGCTVQWVASENRFICPCHGSSFDKAGRVITSPAPRALDRFNVVVEHRMVKVNTGQMVRSQIAVNQNLTHRKAT